MVPYVKNVLLASSDQVAIDAVAAKLMGFDPLSDCKFIRLAHERGLGVGDAREIEIVGDADLAEQSWHFVGPFKEMTFAARMQHRIYWGPLKRWIEWSLKTWLAPWSYVASVVYHDVLWYPLRGRQRVQQALASEWGRLFANWGHVRANERGYVEAGAATPAFVRAPRQLVRMGLKALWTCVREAPELARRRRRSAAGCASATAARPR
jgi:hypothetical protein